MPDSALYQRRLLAAASSLNQSRLLENRVSIGSNRPFVDIFGPLIMIDSANRHSVDPCPTMEGITGCEAFENDID